MDVGEPLQADTATRDTATRAPDMGLKAGILFSNEGGETRLRFSRPSLLVLSRLSLEQKKWAQALRPAPIFRRKMDYAALAS